MSSVVPFRAVHPARGLESRVAALPYDVYNREEARAAALKDPLSFLNIDRPETQFPEGYDMYAPEVYEKAAQMLRDQIADGVYVQDPQACYYIYELTMNGRTQTGLVACASIDDYLNGVIKKHENTREEKEQDRIHHVDACSAQTGPIFLAYRKNETVSGVIARVKSGVPDYDFVSGDGIRHAGWTIMDSEDIRAIGEAFRAIDSIYIADGHHRAASAVKVGLKRRAEAADFDGTEPFNYFLSVLFPDEELMIMDYNRVVRDLNGLSQKEFLKKVTEICSVSISSQPVRPAHKGGVGMYLGATWYRLDFREEYLSSDPVEGLDVSILQNTILGPVLGIQDPRTDPRIDFIGGIRGLKELERRVHSDSAVAFAMYPTSIHELFNVADHGLLMPPKSTWFEPKLRSGLYIHLI